MYFKAVEQGYLPKYFYGDVLLYSLAAAFVLHAVIGKLLIYLGVEFGFFSYFRSCTLLSEILYMQ